MLYVQYLQEGRAVDGKEVKITDVRHGAPRPKYVLYVFVFLCGIIVCRL
jgi:hypothetical protein